EILERINQKTEEHFAAKLAQYGDQLFKMGEKRILLQTLDQLWKDHLLSLDHLRQGIHLRGYGQRDPLNEYKQEAFALFEAMLSQLREMVISRLSHLEIHVETPTGLKPLTPQRTMVESHGDEPVKKSSSSPFANLKMGRNEPCPCGSGKKYKHCHGALG
ncbi:MAG: preprotein translocase subunit SecA, partial [Alphaproteobacteria bacterium]|nr:preprotein translocase subunit SecA [Alphaproteobacteria bacterium]